MYVEALSDLPYVDRRIGGLESHVLPPRSLPSVDRRIGGLEMVRQ